MNRVSLVRRGFTLIELLLSLALLSMILAAVYSTFFLSHKAMDGIDETLVKLQECRMTMDTMGREIESIPSGTGDKNSSFKVEDRDVYGKDASRFTFTSFSPLTPGLAAISYYAEEKDGTLTVFKKIKSAAETGDPKGIEVIEGADAFTVEVRNNDAWVKTWDAAETGKVPDEIRVTIRVMMKGRPVTLFQTASPKTGKAL